MHMENKMPSSAFSAAKDQQVIWKSPEVMAYAVAFVEAGLSAYRQGRAYFSAEDVPDHLQPKSPQIAGSVTSMLLHAHLITSYFGHHPEIGIIHGRKRSTRASRNAAKINLYSIVSVALADAFLRRYRAEHEVMQGELALV